MLGSDAWENKRQFVKLFDNLSDGAKRVKWWVATSALQVDECWIETQTQSKKEPPKQICQQNFITIGNERTLHRRGYSQVGLLVFPNGLSCKYKGSIGWAVLSVYAPDSLNSSTTKKQEMMLTQPSPKLMCFSTSKEGAGLLNLFSNSCPENFAIPTSFFLCSLFSLHFSSSSFLSVRRY